jgi:hypothetical protein
MPTTWQGQKVAWLKGTQWMKQLNFVESMKNFKFTIEHRIIKTNLEYIGWVKLKILELDYGTTYVIVSFCNWVKVNYKGARTTMNINSHW